MSPHNPLIDPTWDARMTALPGATFFHTTAWLRVLHDTYGFTPAYFVGTDANGRESVLPMMETNSWLKGRRGIGLPFTDEAGPLAGDKEAAKALFDEALAHGRNRGWKILECRGGNTLLGGPPVSTAFWGHQIDLTGDEKALFGRLESATRRGIRKAEQSGLRVEVTTDIKGIQTFYHLMGLTRKKHGLPAQPFGFFGKIHEHVLAKDQGCVVLAWHGETPVAGAVYFRFGRSAIYKYGASDESLQHLRANNLVMWEAMKHHAKLGVTSLDLGRTSLSNEGLRKYKLGWGASEHRVEYTRFDLRTNQFVEVRDEAAGWYNYVFRHLPVSVSRLIGSLLYKHAA